MVSYASPFLNPNKAGCSHLLLPEGKHKKLFNPGCFPISWNKLSTYNYGGGGLVTKLCQILATPWTVACRVPLSVGFSRQEYWSGLPFPSPGDLPDPGIEPRSPALQADSLPTELPGKLW